MTNQKTSAAISAAALALALAAASGAGHSAAPAPVRSEPPTATARPGQPTETLQPDRLDLPAPTAIQEATRAAEMAQEMAGGGHGMSHGTYRQVDAGRDDVPPTSPIESAHQGSTPDPHAGHTMPAPRPGPSPSPKVNR